MGAAGSLYHSSNGHSQPTDDLLRQLPDARAGPPGRDLFRGTHGGDLHISTYPLACGSRPSHEGFGRTMRRLREEFCQRDKACVAGRVHPAVLLQRPQSELVASTASWRGFGLRLQHDEGSGPICSNSLKFRVVHVGELRPPDGQNFILVALGVGYYEFEPYNSKLPSAARTADGRSTGACVRLTRPDGSTLETVATISLVSGIQPPAIQGFSGISVADVPKGRKSSSWQMQRKQVNESLQAAQDGVSSPAYVDYPVGHACLSSGGYLNG